MPFLATLVVVTVAASGWPDGTGGPSELRKATAAGDDERPSDDVTATDGPTAGATPPSRPAEPASVGPAPTPPLAQLGDLEIWLPTAEPVLVGFHEAATVTAIAVDPVGVLSEDRNTTRTDLPPDVAGGTPYLVMTSRGRSAGPTSAIDVVMEVDDPVLAPVSGTVVDVRSYLLYGAHRDLRIELVPDDRPDVRLVMIHVEGAAVAIGDRVVGGVTPVAGSARLLPFGSHIDRETEPDRYPHVHLEVQPIDAPRPGDGTRTRTRSATGRTTPTATGMPRPGRTRRVRRRGSSGRLVAVEVLSSSGGEAARWLVQRGVALTCLIAFANIVRQWVPLLGTHGLTPVTEVLRTRPSLAAPSLFHLRYTDRLAVVGGWVGVVVAASLVVGLPQRGPAWAPMLAFLLLWVLYLSYVTVGRIWYAFGWESLLLEATFLAAFLGSDRTAPPLLTLWLLRWLVFRVEVGAGLIKWRGDPCWRELTCLEHHHQTQPLPAPMSWWFHHLPTRLHRLEALANHTVQLAVPFALLLPQPVAGVAAALIVVTQLWLLASGNFSWLNLLTIVLAASALPDAWFAGTPLVAGELPPTPLWLGIASAVLTAVVVVLSLRGPVPNLLSPHQRMNVSHDPLRLVGSYGAFGSVTRERYELEIEATRGDPDDPAAAWRRYRFRAKPGPVDRRPPQVAPRHLRLDWLLWFAAMDPSPMRHRWFEALLVRLLEADPAVLRLLGDDPNGGERPRAVRVVRERTRFTTRAERRRTGDWWVREPGRVVVPPVQLDDGHLRRV